LPGGAQVISLEDPIPAHDMHCPLMSLLPAFGARPDNVPADVPYLRAEPGIANSWAGRLPKLPRPRIGLVWSGRRYRPVNYVRDIELASLAPLFSLGADFIAVQKDVSSEERAVLANYPNVYCAPAGDLRDFADTAALIDNLDLVLSVDTAIAHLAGALGKPVWLLNRYASCWRWLQEGERSVWYPTMRIIRQRSLGDWTAVVHEARMAAIEFIEQQTRSEPKASEIVAAQPSLPQSQSRRRRGKGPEKIRFVCATRESQEEFLAKSPLGRSLPYYRTFPPRQRIELRLFKKNTKGLPAVYNTAIEEAKSDPAILVFIHDDVYLSDYYWAEHLLEGLGVFDIVGLAGNRRRAHGQASWMYLNGAFERDRDENLSGVIGHGAGFPNLIELSAYGPPGQEVKLLDGVMLAVRSEVLIDKGVRFDPQFSFHFYDLDFCRQAEQRGIRMGTWAISLIHGSAGKLGGKTWSAAYRKYLDKYGEH
jgi:hypothetical protein